MSTRHPAGHSKWRHKATGRTAHFLTVASGTGVDKGVEFAYFLAPGKTGNLKAMVMRMETWHEVMEQIEDAPSDNP